MKGKLLFLGIALAFPLLLARGDSVAASAPSTITTYAGKDIGQGGPATKASLYHPSGVALDSAGNLYIADKDNHLVHKVSKASGVITTVAGDGFQGYTGDGGPAIDARLNDPASVAVDSAGNVYFADTTNHRVRKVSTSGTITTVAGNGTACGSLNDGGPATSASLCGPKGIALDAAGNLYIADTYHHRIRKVNTSGTITTIAGNGSPGYSGDGGPATSASLRYPVGVAAGPANSLYVADTDNHRIRMIDASGNISTVAGNGSPGYSGDEGAATDAGLYYPYSLTADSSGNLYIADTSNHRVRKVDTSGDITTVAGDGSSGYSGDGGAATSAGLYYPSNVTIDSAGNLYVADCWNDRVRKVDTSGDISTLAGNGGLRYSGDDGPAAAADLNLPNDMAADASGNVYIADYANDRIRKVTTGGVISTVAGNGAAGYVGDGGAATSTSLYYPSGVAAGADGSFYIADSANSRVRKVDASGVITTVAGTGIPTGSIDGEGGNPADDLGDGGPAAGATLYLPWDVATDLSGNLYVADYDNSRIRKIDASGNITTVAGSGTLGYSGDGGPATSANLQGPSGVAVDGGGNLYIADSANNRVRKVSGSGIITTLAGTGTAGYAGDGGLATSARLQGPDSVALDAAGNLYISDSGNQRIRRVNTLGIITTFAGSGSAGYSGDGGAAASASLNRPRGVALDPSGNLYIADQGNNRIREVTSAASPAAIGGIAEYPPTEPDATATRPGSSAPGPRAFAGVAIAGALLLAATGWLVVRRRVAG